LDRTTKTDVPDLDLSDPLDAQLDLLSSEFDLFYFN
jgi:hypothetical protein